MEGLSALGALVRRRDPDRFLTALFAPAGKREALFGLYALHHELVRAVAGRREAVMGLIRLQWWHEVVEGAPRRHEVATPLAGLLEAGALGRAGLLRLNERFEAEDWVAGTAGEVAVLAGDDAQTLARTALRRR